MNNYEFPIYHARLVGSRVATDKLDWLPMLLCFLLVNYVEWYERTYMCHWPWPNNIHKYYIYISANVVFIFHEARGAQLFPLIMEIIEWKKWWRLVRRYSALIGDHSTYTRVEILAIDSKQYQVRDFIFYWSGGLWTNLD